MDPRTVHTARRAAKRAPSPYKVNDASMRYARLWALVSVFVDTYVAVRLATGAPISTWMIWTFVTLVGLRFVMTLIAPSMSKALKRKNALAREQVHQVRNYGGPDGNDVVAMGLGNLLDADPTLDRRSAEAGLVFAVVSIRQLLDEAEAQVATGTPGTRTANGTRRTGGAR